MHSVQGLAGLRAGFLVLVCSSFLAASAARAEDIQVSILLVWGTNDKKDTEGKHKEVDPDLAKELKNIFTWKYYFEVKKVEGDIPSRTSKSFKMSPKCELKITELPGPELELTLFGEGKPVNRVKKALGLGERISFGGGDKSGTAWFVVVERPKP